MRVSVAQQLVAPWTLFLGCILSFLTFALAEPDIRMAKASRLSLMDFTGKSTTGKSTPGKSTNELTEWLVSGAANNAVLEGNTLAVRSNTGKGVGVSRLIDWNPYLGSSERLVSVDAVIENYAVDEGPIALHGDAPSLFVVRPKGSVSDDQFRKFAFQLLDEPGKRYRIKSTGKVDDRMDSIEILLLLRSTGSWQVTQLEIVSFVNSPLYWIGIVLVMSGWLFLFVSLLRRCIGHWPWAKVLKVGVVCTGIVMGALLSTGLLDWLESHLVWLTERVAMDHMAHLFAHILLSVLLVSVLGRGWLRLIDVLFVNILIILFVETSQTHVSHRTAEVSDALFGLVGCLVVLIIVGVYTIYGNYGKPGSNTGKEVAAPSKAA